MCLPYSLPLKRTTLYLGSESWSTFFNSVRTRKVTSSVSGRLIRRVGLTIDFHSNKFSTKWLKFVCSKSLGMRIAKVIRAKIMKHKNCYQRLLIYPALIVPTLNPFFSKHVCTDRAYLVQNPANIDLDSWANHLPESPHPEKPKIV